MHIMVIKIKSLIYKISQPKINQLIQKNLIKYVLQYILTAVGT